MKNFIFCLLVTFITTTAFSVNPVTVVSPNGGETWTIGCPSTITWLTSNTTGTVKIELFKSNAFYMTIAAQVPPNVNSFTWTPPVTVIPGNTFKVKITSLSTAAGFDFSDGDFTIDPGNITVTSPNGGEVWQMGSTHQILWTDNICDNVRIELWKGGAYNSLITASTPSTGSYTWAIAATSTIVPGNDYRIKIMSVLANSGAASQVFDFSDGNFTIGSGGLTVVTPNGGENWTIGCPYAIQWLNGSNTAPVKIELFKNDIFCLTICAQVPAGMTTYSWIPPATVVPGNSYKVKVTSLTGVAVYDFSDANFSINPGNITVVSPNGGEVWQKGTVHQILWTDNICDNVRIELWKGGVFNSVIAQSVPSNGSFAWAIPATNALVPGNDYKVKILAVSTTPASTTQVFDFSDASFTIGAGGLMVVTPNGGENWYFGGTYLITWIDAIAEPVRIELWKGGVYSSLICSSATGPYSWTIGTGIVPGNDYKVKVIGLTPAGTPGNYDFSDNNFTIAQGNFIIVTSPNGGESWARGSTHIITWLDNISWNVRIELWKGGTFNSLINASTPSTGSCYWAIPATLPNGNDYKVKILAVSNSGAVTLYDFSDNNFSITGMSPTPMLTPLSVVRIYPNPGNSRIHVLFEGEYQGSVTIDIFNFQGDLALQQVMESVSKDESVGIATASLPDGNYLVVVKKDGTTISRNNLLIRH